MTYLDTLRALAAEKQAELVRLEAELAAGRAYLRFLGQRIEAAEQSCADEPECTDPVIGGAPAARIAIPQRSVPQARNVFVWHIPACVRRWRPSVAAPLTAAMVAARRCGRR